MGQNGRQMFQEYLKVVDGVIKTTQCMDCIY